MPTKLRWLHLSDFHFDAGESWDRRRTLKALLEFLAQRKAEGWRPDFVFATGDFANRGKRAEFDQAYNFFRSLAKTLDLDLARDLFLVPGNHDVDRGAKGPADDSILAPLAAGSGVDQQEKIAKVLGHSPTMRLLGGRLAEYYSFTERLLGPARRVQDDKPWRVDTRKVGDTDVAILQLNSAWASGADKEKGNLLVGAYQIEEALAEAATARVRFALVHHPADYLADGDSDYFRNLLQRSGGAHFLLRGHLHENNLNRSVNPSGQLVELAAGAVYQGTQWPKRFLIGELDLDKGEATIEFLTYGERAAGFWTVDTTSYQELKAGLYTFGLPAELRPGQDEVGADPKQKEARHRAIAARYRAAVAAVHGQMRFIGFPAAAAGAQPNVRVQELFVPVQLAVRGRGREVGKEDPRMTTAGLLQRLLPPNEKQGRFVVLGDPGSGKTTLCRFAAAFFTGELTQKDVELRGEPLPLFLPFRDYMRRRHEVGECGLVDYLVEQAHSHLQVGSLDRAMLEEALAAGNAVLLLDGLDEVGNPQERVEMRDRVLAFCKLYPRFPVLLTSRFAGYEDAPLPPDLFERLELKPFEDEDLRVFVTNWYAVQEPSDPQARERGIADLLAALATEPRVRALASNPLLATLIALVHRTEAQLPGERAKLYELVVRTLLETWPKQARREFQEIDAGLQRTYLEDFALAQQEKRSSADAEVAFERGVLVASLAEILGRQQQAAPKETLRRTAESWVEFLAVGTGLIVEQRPGVFAFLHLSFLEYLAACALDRQEEALEERIAKQPRNSVWQEVLLLAVGRHATALPFLERLFAQLESKSEWFFLLLCLREEAAFDDTRRAAILDSASLELLKLRPDSWFNAESVVRTIERFSIRNAEQARRWRITCLQVALGEKLRSSVAVSFKQPDEIRDILERRPDREVAAADLLEFWPGSELGLWAIENVTAERLRFSIKASPAELAVVRSLAALALGTSPQVSLAVAPLQLHASSHFIGLVTTALSGVSEFERAGERGVPPVVVEMIHSQALVTRPSWVKELRQSYVQPLPQVFAPIYSRFISKIFASTYDRAYSELIVFDWSFELASKLFGVHLGPLTRFGRCFEDSVLWQLPRAWGGDLPALKLEFSTVAIRGPGAPDIFENPSESRSFSAGRKERRLKVSARFAAETWIALVTTARLSEADATAYLCHRLQYAALLYLWPAIDGRLPADPEPERLALYFQLGWTQSTTTHEWPATERWIALMKAGPPAHWLPRAQWHLCWLLHDNDDAGHQRAFNEALREGLADSDLGRHAVATTLEQVIGFYP